MPRRGRELTSRSEFYGGTFLKDHKVADTGQANTISLGYSYARKTDATSGIQPGSARGFLMPLNDWVTLDQVGVHFQNGATEGTGSCMVAIYKNVDRFEGVRGHFTNPGRQIFFQDVQATGSAAHVATEALDEGTITLPPGLYWVVCGLLVTATRLYKRHAAYYNAMWTTTTDLAEGVDYSDLGVLSTDADMLWATFRVAETWPGSGLHNFDRRVQLTADTHIPQDNDTVTDHTSVANTVYYVPFEIPVGRVLSEMKVHQDTGTSDLELGVYTHKPGVGPDGLIVKTGPTSHGAGFFAFSSIGQYLPAGKYWAALQVDTAITDGFKGGISSNLMFSNAVDEYPQYCMTESSATTLPATATPSDGLNLGPKMWISFEEGVHGVMRSSELHIPGAVMPIKDQWIGPMCTPIVVASQKFVPSAQELYCIPIINEMPVRSLDLQAIMQAFEDDATETVRLGYYRDNGSFYPGVLLEDSGNKDMQSNPSHRVSTPSTLVQPPGVYWVAILIHAITDAQFSRHFSCHPNTFHHNADAVDYSGLRATSQGTGALPDPAPSGMVPSATPRLNIGLATASFGPPVLF